MHGLRHLVMGVILLTIVAMPNGSSAQVCPTGSQQTAVKGKIFNNITSGGRTLGVVALVLGQDKSSSVKIKCAILGDPLPPDANFQVKFIHTLVCEDHSQLSFLTQGNVTEVFPSGGFSFAELSTPILDNPLDYPRTRLFANITEGSSLGITGTVNPLAEVDMTFEGHACFLP